MATAGSKLLLAKTTTRMKTIEISNITILKVVMMTHHSQFKENTTMSLPNLLTILLVY